MNLVDALIRRGVPADKARAFALTPVTPPDLAYLPVGAACAQVAQDRGWVVESLERPGRTRYMADLPDLRLRRAGASVWFEAKSDRDKLTRGQFRWLASEYLAGGVVGCGGLADLRVLLTAIEQGDGAATGWQLVAHWARKGWRT